MHLFHSLHLLALSPVRSSVKQSLFTTLTAVVFVLVSISFAHAQDVPTWPPRTAAVDLNGDGLLDYATAATYKRPDGTQYGALVVVLTESTDADGNATLSFPITLPTGTRTLDVATGDFDNDGTADVVVVDQVDIPSRLRTAEDNKVFHVFLNKDGQFGADLEVNTYPGSIQRTQRVKVGDLNNDGHLDIVGFTRVLSGSPTGPVHILLNDGTGHFSNQSVLHVVSDSPDALGCSFHQFANHVGDVNGDGNADILVAGESYKPCANDNDQSTLALLTGNGDGTFTTAYSQRYYGLLSSRWIGDRSSPLDMAVADVNGDGTPDLVMGDQEGYYGIHVLHNDGLGNFTSAQDFTLKPGYAEYNVTPKFLQTLDVGCDGTMDVLFTPYAGAYGPVHIMLNNGDGTLNSATVNTLLDAPVPGLGVLNPDSSGDGRWDIKAGYTSAVAVQIVPVNLAATQDAICNPLPDPPVANFTKVPQTVVPGELVTFTDTSTGEITSWLWDLGDGTTSTEQHVTHVYDAPGVYTISLMVTGAGGNDTAVQNGVEVVEPEKNSKVFVCHTKPKKHDKTLHISGNAVDAHLAHGDYLGACK